MSVLLLGRNKFTSDMIYFVQNKQVTEGLKGGTATMCHYNLLIAKSHKYLGYDNITGRST